jgi:hypothetical protein
MSKYIIYINSDKAEVINKWFNNNLDGEYRQYFGSDDVSLGSFSRNVSYVPVIVSDETYFKLKDMFSNDCGCPKPPVINRDELTIDYIEAIGGDTKKPYDMDNQFLSSILDIASRIIEEKYRVEKR